MEKLDNKNYILMSIIIIEYILYIYYFLCHKLLFINIFNIIYK